MLAGKFFEAVEQFAAGNPMAAVSIVATLVVALRLLLRLRREVRARAAYRAVVGSDRIAIGQVFRTDGNQSTSYWRLTEVRKHGAWLTQVDEEGCDVVPLVESWWPIREFLDKPVTIVRN